MTIESVNPANSEIIGQVETTPIKYLPKILAEARAAQEDWARVPIGKRAGLMEDFSRLLRTRKSVVADLISKENGKPLIEAYSTEIIPALDFARYYAKRSAPLLRQRRVKMSLPLLYSKKAVVRYEPLGVVAIIAPWNYPLMLPLGQIIPALMAGNAVVFKPSEHTPLTGELIADFFWEIGIPKQLLALVQGAGDVGAALVSAQPDRIFFTGSTAVGKKVSEAAAKNLTPVSLELGSKDAMIVLADANINAAASGAIWGAFMNAGQTCVSVERCLVDERILNVFNETLRAKIEKLRSGKSVDHSADIGPIINRTQFELIRDRVKEAVSRGGRIVSGGAFSDGDGGYYIQPTLLTDVPLDTELMREETMGPILPVVGFRTEQEAIDLVNAAKSGLSASIWTADANHGLEIGRRLKTGAVSVNDVVSYYGVADGVVGGVGESGSGRVHGREGIMEMVVPKYYEIERAARFRKIWWYNYDKNSLSFFETSVDLLFSKNPVAKLQSLLKLLPKMLRIKKL